MQINTTDKFTFSLPVETVQNILDRPMKTGDPILDEHAVLINFKMKGHTVVIVMMRETVQLAYMEAVANDEEKVSLTYEPPEPEDVEKGGHEHKHYNLKRK